MNLLESIRKSDNLTFTENGMPTNKSSLDSCVDLFFTIGALRTATESTVRGVFFDAFEEHPQTALRILLWARDARAGAGERRFYRIIFRELFSNVENNDVLIPFVYATIELGRWDDLLEIYHTPNTKGQQFVSEVIFENLMRGNKLCAKWMPRKGEVAAKIRKHLGISPRQWRKTLVHLNDTVERKMCAKEWNKINYEHVPSVAAARYQRAFNAHDGKRYQEYIDSVQRGEKKVNASAVYPYDVVKSILGGGDDRLANEQWKALPDYMEGSEYKNILPVIDTSGSMYLAVSGSTRSIDVSVSLGLYLAEHNKGQFSNHFITFSQKPELQKIQGTTLRDKIVNLSNASWGFNTNIEKVFDLVLGSAVSNNVPSEEMPDCILIISDMEFDQATRLNQPAMQMIEQKFFDAGYKVPSIVFWNVFSRRKNVPVEFNKQGVALVSGFSPSIMKSILNANFDELTPTTLMYDAIGEVRYNLGIYSPQQPSEDFQDPNL